MKLFATMCNQPQRLTEAIAPVRSALVVPGPVSRWGLGYVQGGEVLLMRTPRPSEAPVDLFEAMASIRSDCVIGQGVSGSSRYTGNDNTPPFRFRRWMFAQLGEPRGFEDAWLDVLEKVPEHLRRNMKGRTPAELTFHVLLAMLQDRGLIDDANLAPAITRKTVADATTVVAEALSKAGGGEAGNLAVSNSRSLVVVRLGDPLYLRRLQVAGERTERDHSFRGVLVVSSPTHPGEGFEELGLGQAVLVHRDLRVDLST